MSIVLKKGSNIRYHDYEELTEQSNSAVVEVVKNQNLSSAEVNI